MSKLLDRSINILADDFGLQASAPVHGLVSALEEPLEPSLLVLAQHRWRWGMQG